MTSKTTISSPQQEYDALLAEIQPKAQHVKTLRYELCQVVTRCHTRMARRTSQTPGKPTSYYQHYLRDYWRSFELFTERLKIARETLEKPLSLEALPPLGPDATEGDWDNVLNYLDDLLESLRLHKQVRKDLLLVLDLVDSTERLLRLVPPSPPSTRCDIQKWQIYADSFDEWQATTGEAQQNLRQNLNEKGVTAIELKPGGYPPPELTRVIDRVDHGTDDNIVINDISRTGYTWNNNIIRKAEVIVITNTGD